MTADLVSIVIPIFNVEKYLPECIESVINQSYTNLEIILINDGSTDSSFDICKLYQFDKRIILVNKENQGLSVARQLGLDLAQGEYLCMIDSDDYISEDYIEKMYLKINDDKSDICICETRFFSANNSKVSSINNSVNSINSFSKCDIETKFSDLVETFAMSDSWSKIYSMKFIRNTMVKFSLPKEYNGTDLLYNHCLMLHTPQISVLKEPLYNYRIVENSRVRRKNKQLHKGFMIIVDELTCEIERMQYSNLINNQLGRLYVKLLRYAMQDVYLSTPTYKEVSCKLKDIFSENARYIERNNRISLTIKDMDTFSLKVFCCLVLLRNIYLLYAYLLLRQKLLA